MNRNLFAVFAIFTISCAANTTEDSFATPSTISQVIENRYTESEYILLKSAEKILQELGFLTANLKQAITEFQHQNMLETTGKLDAITYFALLEKFKLAKLPVAKKVYAIETIKCEKYGQWVQFYKGTLKKNAGNIVEVKLLQRYGFKHHPTKQGVSSTDWFCIPKRKYCYSEIDFHAWQGKHQPNDIVKFPKADIFLANIGVISGIEDILQKQCKQ